MTDIQATSPYSIRFTLEERQYIRAEAEKLKLKAAAYIRLRLFDERFKAQSSAYRKKADQSEQQTMAQLLAMLGQSRMANNLNQIAKAIHTGTLVVTPEMTAQLSEACQNTQLMRTVLLKGLGLKG